MSAGLTGVVVWIAMATAADSQLRDPASRERVAPATALSHMGKHGVPYLTAALRDRNPDVRRYAAWALGQSSAGDAAVRELAELLGDPVAAVRDEAADALANIGRPAAEVLRAAMKGPDPLRRAAALRAFGSSNPRRGGIPLPNDYKPRGLRPVNEPSFVGPDLSDTLCDPDIHIRWAAIDYLTRVGISQRLADVKADAMPGLKVMLFDPNAHLRWEADRFLMLMGENPDQLRQQRLADLTRRFTHTKLGTLTALAGPSTAHAALPAVALAADAHTTALRAATAVFQFRKDRNAKFPQGKALLDLSERADPLTAHMVAYQLIGVTDDPRIADRMRAGLSSPDAGVRVESASGLLRLYPQNAKVPDAVFTKLRDLAEDPTPRVRMAVFEARLRLLPAGDERKAAVAAGFRDPHQPLRTAAFQATPSLGLAALPELEKAASDPDSDVRRLAYMFQAAVIREIPTATPAHAKYVLTRLLKALDDPSYGVRAEAAPRLATLRGGDYRLYGPHAIPTDLQDKLFTKLTAMVRSDPERVIRVRAIHSLATFGDRAGEVLIPLLKDPAVRDTIASVAPALGKHGEACVPVLREMLKGTPQQRGAAMFPLQRLGPRAKEALPELVALMSDTQARASGVVQTLVAVDSSGEHAIPAILKALGGKPENTSDRDAMFHALVRYGPIATDAVPLLEGQMKLGVTSYNAELAAAIGPKAAPVAPLLAAALRDAKPNQYVPDAAIARALASIGVKSDDVLKALRDRLPGTNGRANIPSAMALVTLADDKEAAAILAKAFDPKSPLCSRAVEEVQHFPIVRKKYADAIRTLADTDTQQRIPAIRAMIALGEGKRYVTYLTNRIQEKGYEYNLAISLLEQIGPDAAEAVPILRRLIPTVQYDWQVHSIEKALVAISKPTK